MTDIPFTQVDAFVVDGKPLTGNPAAVMILDDWLPDETMQAVAVENNLSETAFLGKADGGEADWHLRWFTPSSEVNMCGHATIASGHVVIDDAPSVRFKTKSGVLPVSRDGDTLILDLPANPVAEVDRADLCQALGIAPRPLHFTDRYDGAAIVLLDSQEDVEAVSPDFAALRDYPYLVIVTAPGRDTDIASRVFAGGFGIDEDPVTGSAHAALGPFWADRLGRDRFTALQASARGGHLDIHLDGDRVKLGGICLTVIEGTFRL
ncbi:PhzF family phenazine biosynthesis protein [Sphingomicrobium clamense]|uniref:PhzF family phenazine biosynthesis protein n=1 Tax=Sphingomicrobium clamense TaxID=2851013 RepID=A0ABS6V9I6_9SPHN|nr:PhzF family phenazine biosynthesis protein [Sphingomicrobium sp. B8]MBW0145733.1 PhzF family phenazine biosynthesis protein [Sphingomicrobium sp. B8]